MHGVQRQVDEFLQVRDGEIVNSHDWFLRSFIDRAIDLGFGVGLTLNVGGITVSGDLISGQEYFEAVGKIMSVAAKSEGDAASVLGKELPRYAALYDKPENAPDDWQTPRSSFIHLREARFYAPGQEALTDEGVFWRGKLSSVDGFFIGRFLEE